MPYISVRPHLLCSKPKFVFLWGEGEENLSLGMQSVISFFASVIWDLSYIMPYMAQGHMILCTMRIVKFAYPRPRTNHVLNYHFTILSVTQFSVLGALWKSRRKSLDPTRKKNTLKVHNGIMSSSFHLLEVLTRTSRVNVGYFYVRHWFAIK
jgi:hypothetical protein